VEALGYITLAIFIVSIILTLFRKINLPVQTILVLVSIVCLLVGAVFRAVSGNWAGVLLLPNEMLGGIILHPITALLAGLFMAGALSASGGFEALKVLILCLNKTPIGLAGTLVILVQLPVIASLPCGRIIAAALLPLLFAFGMEGGMGLLTKSQLVVLVGAFARNAFGSCGPSPIGGVGQVGEGFLGAYFPTAADGILRGAQAFSLFLGTALVALFLKFVAEKLYPEDVGLKDKSAKAPGAKIDLKAPLRGYVSLAVFVASLLIGIFQPFGKMPVQTVLVAGGILIILSCRVRLQDLMNGIILLPVTAMASGFMAAGALAATGGFNALGTLLKGLAVVPFLGVAGMLVIFVQIQTILPLSCSRILTAALAPVLYMFGPAGYNLITWPQLAIAMAAYIINATTSCGPSPLGGGGMMAEGQLRAQTGYIKGAFTFAAMAIMAPLAAIYERFIAFSVFRAPGLEARERLGSLIVYSIIIVAVAIALIIGLAHFIKRKPDLGWKYQFGCFIAGGLLCGVVLSVSLFEFKIVPMLQGAVAGVVASSLVALMLPKNLSVKRLLKPEAVLDRE
jgi:hypothetical protein